MSSKQITVTPTSPANEPSELEPHLEAAAQLSDSAKKAVREELHRLLASSRFSSSHRCQALLRYVVENALKGRADSLKERSIGAAVFGRDLAYDTNSDPVVRMVAGEVRKKLAQYYYDHGNDSELQIVMRTGSYVPELSWPNLHPRTDEKGVPIVPPMDEEESEKQAGASSQFAIAAHRLRRAIPWLVAGFAVGIASVLLFQQFRPKPSNAPKPPDAFESFWAPVVKSPKPALLCVGHRMLTWSQYDSDQAHLNVAPRAKPAGNRDQKNRSVMLLSDSMTLGGLTALLREEKKVYWVRGQAFTRFEDLQSGPVVLLGAFNNKWTMRLMETMRFHFAEEPNGSAQWIADQQAPAARIGLVHVNTEDFTVEDYALVARVFDPQTQRPTIIVAGVTAAATHAAGEFVTNPDYLDAFSRRAPQNWQTKNMELLIITKNVNGDSGSPDVVASYFW